ncbi:hypothetical protein LPJ74_002676 [Coemansia sp. RSA 1843]|nr:hypothetical protein LPJ74_002676 [Coemansia sp. RSA 1843]
MARLLQQASMWTSLALVLMQGALGNLTGSGTITFHDYQSLPLAALANNPPSCGMAYADLDITRITAVQQMNKATDCGQCVKVTNANDPSRYVYVLAVDTGGRGLDLSKPAFGKILNIDDGVGAAEWGPVDSSYCAGIWSNSPQGGAYQQPASSTLSAVVAQPPASSAPAPVPTQQVPVAPARPSTQAQVPRSTTSYAAPPASSSANVQPAPSHPETTNKQPEQNELSSAEKESELPEIGHNVDKATSAEESSLSVEEGGDLAAEEDSANEDVGDTTQSSAASPIMRVSLAGLTSAALAAVTALLL